MPRKPKRWIERLPVTPMDDLHAFFMRELGFEAYVRQGVVLLDPPELLARYPQIHYNFWSMDLMRRTADRWAVA